MVLEAMLVDASFSGLNADERRYLREWQASARAIGIDAVEDLHAAAVAVYHRGHSDRGLHCWVDCGSLARNRRGRGVGRSLLLGRGSLSDTELAGRGVGADLSGAGCRWSAANLKL